MTIEELNQKDIVSDEELHTLKSGKDEWSFKDVSFMQRDTELYQQHLIEHSIDNYYRPIAYRWLKRGLRIDLAIRKAKIVNNTNKLYAEKHNEKKKK